MAEELELIPVPTRILTDKDDIIEAIEHYTEGKIGPDDLVCSAESVVAITQGRYVRPEDLEISCLARLCCRFIPDYGSLASPHGMQSLMDVEGQWRVAFALFAGFLGKIVGQSGLYAPPSAELIAQRQTDAQGLVMVVMLLNRCELVEGGWVKFVVHQAAVIGSHRTGIVHDRRGGTEAADAGHRV